MIDTLARQEAKASSKIESMVTTQDWLFQADLFPEGPHFEATKVVLLDRYAVKLGFQRLVDSDGRL